MFYNLNPYEKEREGKCETCGFLSKYDIRPNPPQYLEVTYLERTTGNLENSDRSIPIVPCCYMRVMAPTIEILPEDVADKISAMGPLPRENFPKRVMEAISGTSWGSIDLFTTKVRSAIYKDRNCPSLYPYTHGFSPTEHREEARLYELERNQQEFQARLEEGRKVHERKMEQERKDFDKSLHENMKQFQLRLTLFLIFFAAIQVGVALIQLAFPDGWPWLMSLIDNEAPQNVPLDIPGGF